MIGWIIAIVGGAIAGWVLRGKADKKPAYKSGMKLDDEE